MNDRSTAIIGKDTLRVLSSCPKCDTVMEAEISKDFCSMWFGEQIVKQLNILYEIVGNESKFAVRQAIAIVNGLTMLDATGVDTSALSTAKYAAALLDCENAFSTDLQHADMGAVYYWREEILSALAIAKQLQEKEDE